MPEWRPEIRRRLHAAGLRPEREAEIVDEIAQHLEDHYREQLAAGATAGDAELRAWAELDAGDRLARWVAHAERPAPSPQPAGVPPRRRWAAALWQDAKYVGRRLRQRPAFSLTAIVTVALVTGPATAVLGTIDAVFFRQPPGITQPHRLLLVQAMNRNAGGSYSPFAPAPWIIDAMVAASPTVTSMAGQASVTAGMAVGRDDGTDPIRRSGQAVQGNYFELLGIRMVAGRAIRPEDDAPPGGQTAVVLAAGVASDLYGAPESAVGKAILLNGVPFTVVGVADRAFRGTARLDDSSFWISGAATNQLRHLERQYWDRGPNRGYYLEFIARLNGAATPDQAVAELERAVKLAPDATDRTGIQLYPGLGAPASANPTGLRAVRMLLWAVGTLMLLGIANLANLLLSDAIRMTRDVVIRRALGASVARIAQFLIVQSLLIACAGAALGVLLALGLERWLADLSVYGLGEVRVPLDWRVAGAAAALTIGAGLAFGAAPVWWLTRRLPAAPNARGGAPRASGARHALAAVQVAVSMALVVSALLIVTSVRNLLSVEKGFDPAGVSRMSADLRNYGYTQPRMWTFYRELTRRLSEQPGIEAVGVALAPPLRFSYINRLSRPGAPADQRIEIITNIASTGYFDVFGIRATRGRLFDESASYVMGPPSEVVLTHSAARALFGDDDPIGQAVEQPGRTPLRYTVVGITPDIRSGGLSSAIEPAAYLPFSDGYATLGASVFVKSGRTVDEATRLIAATAAGLDRTVPLYGAESMDALIGKLAAEPRLIGRVLGLVSVIAVVLASVGLYGLVWQSVMERSRELGVRMAIGASRRHIAWLVGRRMLLVVLIGLAVGAGAAMLASRVLTSQFFGVSPGDPVILAAAAAGLAAIVAAAIARPLHHATTVDPVTVLRAE